MKSEEHATEVARGELRGAGGVGLKPAPVVSRRARSVAAPQETSHAAGDASALASQLSQMQRQGSLGTSVVRARVPEAARGGRGARGREPLTHEERVLLMTLAAGAPAVVVSLVLLWVGDYTPK